MGDCLMIDWDQKFLEKWKLFDIAPEVYTRFKDDLTIATESL